MGALGGGKSNCYPRGQADSRRMVKIEQHTGRRTPAAKKKKLAMRTAVEATNGLLAVPPAATSTSSCRGGCSVSSCRLPWSGVGGHVPVSNRFTCMYRSAAPIARSCSHRGGQLRDDGESAVVQQLPGPAALNFPARGLGDGPLLDRHLFFVHQQGRTHEDPSKNSQESTVRRQTTPSSGGSSARRSCCCRAIHGDESSPESGGLQPAQQTGGPSEKRTAA